MGALIFITIVDLNFHGSGRIMNTGRAMDYPVVTPHSFEDSPTALAKVRDLTNQTVPPSRIDVVQGSRNWSTSANIMHLPSASGDEPLALARILKLRSCFTDAKEWERYSLVSKLDSKVIDLLNIRYLLASEPDEKAIEAYPVRRIAMAGNHTVYENADPLPRFFLASEIRPAANFEESLSEVCSPGFDPARTAVVEGAGDLSIAPADTSQQGTVRALQYSAEFIELEVSSPSPSFVVSSETYYPGWRAEVNGQEAPILMTNAAFRGLAVPAGKSRVTMSFHPRDLFHGALISTAGWVGLFVVLLAAGFKRLFTI